MPSRDALKAVATAQRRAEMMAADNAALVMQLNARPTAKQHAHLQRQVTVVQLSFRARPAHARLLLLCASTAWATP